MAEKPTMAVRIPKRLWEKVTAFVRRHGDYLNEAEYVREAVRFKLDYDESKEKGDLQEYQVSRQAPSHGGRKEHPPP